MTQDTLRVNKKYFPRERSCSIAGAVAIELDGSDYDRGALEAAASTAENAVGFLGRMLEKLHEKNVLSDVDVLDLLEGVWEVVPE